MNRNNRRFLTYRAAKRRYLRHLKLTKFGGKSKSVLYFRKRKPLDCGCRRRKHGNPKMGTGVCHGHDRREAVDQRIAWRTEKHRWLRSKVDGDDFVAEPIDEPESV